MKRIIKTSTIPYEEFGIKHLEYMAKALTCKFNVAEGAIRAGKTIDNCYIFSVLLDYSEDKIHLASGSTLANALLNIGDCNGFGLEHLFRGRCHWGKYKDNRALYIDRTPTGEKIIIFAGGGKADSYKKILGNSYGLWIATEINEHYDCEDSRTSFIKVAMGRQVASKQPVLLWDLNPSDPNDTIYKWYIDKWQNGIVGGYNYEHFTIEDNKSITEERKAEIKSQYDPSSVWYQRDILGLRVVAQGRIYQEFKEHHVIKMVDWNNSDMKKQLQFITVGVDFGGTGSAHSFNATGFTNNFKHIITIKQKRIAERIDDIELTDAFITFIKELKEEYPGINIIDIRCDSAEQTLIAGFQRALIANQLALPINNAIKGKILNRIRFYCKMFSTNKYYILECCEPLINAFSTSIWDKSKINERLDDGTTDIDSLDAQEYSTEPFMDALIRIN